MKKKILVIEDERGIRENLQLLLESEGYSAEAAPNGKEGIDKIESYKPDLIICDIMMPGMDGFEVLRQVNSPHNTDLIPFIFLTAKVERADMRKGMNLGADDYIFKPYDADELMSAVKSRLKKYEIIKARYEENKESSSKYSLTDSIVFRVRDHQEAVIIGAITHIISEKQYTSIYVENNKRYIVKKSLTAWEALLPANSFIRIHRSVLINMKYVDKIDRTNKNHYLIKQKETGKTFNVSRRFYKNLKNLQ